MFFSLSRLSLRWICCLGLCSALTVGAQSYPHKPIRFVVGYPPGGSGDLNLDGFSCRGAEADQGKIDSTLRSE